MLGFGVAERGIDVDSALLRIVTAEAVGIFWKVLRPAVKDVDMRGEAAPVDWVCRTFVDVALRKSGSLGD